MSNTLNFGDAERKITQYIREMKNVNFHGKIYRIDIVGKPTSPTGEPKTDLYILLVGDDEKIEVKISYKKDNADFVENKIKAERAEQLLGTSWQEIIANSTLQLQEKFLARPLIYKKSFRRTNQGSITLGWKFELVNKPSGELSGVIQLTKEQLKDIYAGTNLSSDKRNALVNGVIIPNSGVANYILIGNSFKSAQEIINNLVTIDEYINLCPEIYFACKALNYRTFVHKTDGNRPLSVQVNWSVINNKLISNLVFNKPLQWNGHSVRDQLLSCLNELNIKTTNDINQTNTEMIYVYE